MIFCVLLNPTIDTIVQIPHFRAGGTYQVNDGLKYPVGKAISVALTLAALGRQAYVVALIGAKEIPQYEEFLTAHHIDHTLFPVNGTTRSNITIIDDQQNLSTHIRFMGFRVTEADLEQINAFLESHVQPGDFVAFSGSAPPSTPKEYYIKPSEIVNKRGGKLLIDTSGEWLKGMRLYNPYAIKGNLEEIGQILGIQLSKQEELENTPDKERLYSLLDHCAELNEWKTAYNIITLAQYGALAFNRKEAYHAVLRLEHTPYTIGCGDAFLGGLLAGLEQNLPLEACLRLAVACGAANTQTLGAGLIQKMLVDQFLSQVSIERLR